jgi:hypothetical protein
VHLLNKNNLGLPIIKHQITHYFFSQFKQLSKSRWIQVYFSLVILQTILSIPILVKTLINTEMINKALADTSQPSAEEDRRTVFGISLTAKGYKIIYENVLFIIFEIWRLWTLTDGVKYTKRAFLYYFSPWYFLDCSS